MKTYGNGPKGMRYGGNRGGNVVAKKMMGGMNTGMSAPMPMNNTMKPKMMAGGGLPMTTVKGKKVPAFAADGKGKNDLA